MPISRALASLDGDRGRRMCCVVAVETGMAETRTALRIAMAVIGIGEWPPLCTQEARASLYGDINRHDYLARPLSSPWLVCADGILNAARGKFARQLS